MQTDNRLIDDLARILTGAVGVAAEARREAEGLVRDRMQRLLDGMDLVRREEFEAVRGMAARAREEQEAMAERIAALEARVAALEAGTGSPGGDGPVATSETA